MMLPPAYAHTPPWYINSYAYLFAAPDPVGVDQNTYISMWVDISLPGSMVTNDIRRENYTLTITKPDGKVETMHWDVVDDTTNVQSISYVPDQVGNYTIRFDYGGQVYKWNSNPSSPYYVSGLGTNAVYENDTYGPH